MNQMLAESKPVEELGDETAPAHPVSDVQTIRLLRHHAKQNSEYNTLSFPALKGGCQAANYSQAGSRIHA